MGRHPSGCYGTNDFRVQYALGCGAVAFPTGPTSPQPIPTVSTVKYVSASAAGGVEWRPTSRTVFAGTVHVLGGGAGPRTLPAGVADMEEIDPDRVALPEWYEPDPGRAEEVAFIMFSGRGAEARANRITNRRWALSALGTASAVALTSNDTAYCWTPIQHPTGLLVSISGALTGGPRLAVANGFTAPAFWEDANTTHKIQNDTDSGALNFDVIWHLEFSSLCLLASAVMS